MGGKYGKYIIPEDPGRFFLIFPYGKPWDTGKLFKGRSPEEAYLRACRAGYAGDVTIVWDLRESEVFDFERGSVGRSA